MCTTHLYSHKIINLFLQQVGGGTPHSTHTPFIIMIAPPSEPGFICFWNMRGAQLLQWWSHVSTRIVYSMWLQRCLACISPHPFFTWHLEQRWGSGKNSLCRSALRAQWMKLPNKSSRWSKGHPERISYWGINQRSITVTGAAHCTSGTCPEEWAAYLFSTHHSWAVS